MSSIERSHRASNDTPARTPTYRSFSEITQRLGRDSRSRLTHVGTLHRWRSRGVLLSDGTRQKLMALREPGRWVTTDEWLDEFLAAITGDCNRQSDTVHARSTKARSETAKQIDQELDRIGL